MKHYNFLMAGLCFVLGIVFVLQGLESGDKPLIGIGAILFLHCSAFAQLENIKNNKK
jgi:hypothetical protein